jgi:tetratricopeptide (TPR) repeat protein
MTKKRLKGYVFLFILIISAGVIVFGMVILNDNVTRIGIIELNGFLNDANREESNIDYLGMVSKFKLHMEFYRDTINQKQFDKAELRVAMVISSYSTSLMIYDKDTYNIFSSILMVVINFFRGLIEKPPLSFNYDNPTNNDLTLAYYYERNNYYEKAFNIYERTLENSVLDQKKIPIIMIHKGFCMVFLRRMEEAKNILRDVIDTYTNENAAVTAAILLQYIIYFEEEIKKTKASDVSDLEKSEKLYKLIAYNDAIEILDTILLEDEEQKDTIQYLKARCYEETGQKENAAIIYQEIIEENPDSEIAELSNNRILLMGTIDKNLEELKSLAEANNEEIQSTGFSEMLEVTDQYEEKTSGSYEDALIDKEIEKSTEAAYKNGIDEFVEESLAEIQEKAGEPTPAELSKTYIPTITTLKTEIPVKTPLVQKTPLPDDKTPVPVQTPPPNLDKVKKKNDDGTYMIIHNSQEGISFKIEYFSESGSLQYYIEYIYDLEGKIIGVVKKDEKGNIID